MDELVKDLTLDMISEGLYRMIAEAIGTDNFYKLAEIVGGTTIYIPKPESLTRPSATPASRKSSPATTTRNSPGSTASPRDGFGAFAAPGKRKGRSGSSTTWKTLGTNTRTRGLVILRSASYIKFHKTTLK